MAEYQSPKIRTRTGGEQIQSRRLFRIAEVLSFDHLTKAWSGEASFNDLPSVLVHWSVMNDGTAIFFCGGRINPVVWAIVNPDGTYRYGLNHEFSSIDVAIALALERIVIACEPHSEYWEGGYEVGGVMRPSERILLPARPPLFEELLINA